MQAGFARKYAIMEELDGGFGAGSTPEAFVRLDSWEGRIQANIHVKGLKQGPFKYRLYLIFADRGKLKPLLLGDVNTSYNGMQGGLEIDAQTLIDNDIRPDYVKYAALTAESQNKKWIPLFSSFEKNGKWEESIRQIIIMSSFEKPNVEHKEDSIDEDFRLGSVYTSNVNTHNKIQESSRRMDNPYPANAITEAESDKSQEPPKANNNEVLSKLSGECFKNNDKACGGSGGPCTGAFQSSNNENPFKSPADTDTRAYRSRGGISKKINDKSKATEKSNLAKLEGMLSNNFDVYHPFKRANKGYLWYKVSDLSQLSNIMYMSGINVPLFANPKILVGLFKYKHILAGIYKGEMNDNYYVIGVPAKDKDDNKPFENACRWAPVEESETRDMTGYWLVYVSIDTGQIVV